MVIHGGQKVFAREVEEAFEVITSVNPIASVCSMICHHPCVLVQWQMPSSSTSAVGAQVLTTASIGLCQAADQVVQGTVLIQKTQMKASAR